MRSRGAFSLVEVSLALAVVAVAMLAILGLLPQGIQASRNAVDNTLSATIVQDTFNGLRTQPFNNAVVCDACGVGGVPKVMPLDTFDTTVVGPVSNAYDQAGFGTTWAKAYYKVMLDYQPQTPLNLTRVTATVVWPAQSKAPINTNVFVTAVAWYDQ